MLSKEQEAAKQKALLEYGSDMERFWWIYYTGTKEELIAFVDRYKEES